MQKNALNKTEMIAGVSVYMTLSYILILNPILLAKSEIDISAAFFATVISASVSTYIMGIWARLPFAVAPAPSLTTFFVSYICIKLGLSWQAALASAFLSGVLSIAITFFSLRGKVIDTIPDNIRIGVLFSLGGFLIANGLNQAKVIGFTNGFFDFTKFNVTTNSIWPLFLGIILTFGLKSKRINVNAAPIIAIGAAALLCWYLGIKSTSKAEFSKDMLSAVNQMDFSFLRNTDFLLSILLFFIIDFFGGVGKYIGLFEAMEEKKEIINDEKMGKALYVDGIGNLIGGFLGASSLAVFVSSAVGIKEGGRTGGTAIVTATLILLSLVFIPLVGAIPVEATTGVLIYIGFILLPFDKLLFGNALSTFEKLVITTAFVVSFFTFSIDKAITVVFLFFVARDVIQQKFNFILIVIALLLLLANIAQTLI